MAKIPTFESGRTITSPAGTPRPSPAAAVRPSQAIVAAGRTIEQVGQVFQRARDLEQFTTAKTEITRRLGELQSGALNTEINSTDDFEKLVQDSQSQMNTIKGEVLANITNPEIRTKMGGAFDLDAISSMSAIKSNARKKWVTSMKVGMLENIDELKDLYVRAANPVHKQQALNDIREAIRNHVALGVIKTEAGREMLKEIEEDLPIADAENMIDLDPITARQMLQQKAFGVKSAEDREKLFKDIESSIKRNEAEAEFNANIRQNELQHEVTNDIINGEITSLSELDARRATLDPAYYEIAREYFLSDKKYTTADKAAEYVALVNQSDELDESDFGQVAKYRKNVIKAASNGSITEASMRRDLEEINSKYNSALRGIVETEFKDGKAVRGFWKKLFTFGEKPIPKEDQDEAMMLLDKRLREETQGKELTPDELTETANSIFREYVTAKHPDLLGTKQPVNNVKSIGKPTVQTTPPAPIVVNNPAPDRVRMESPTGEIFDVRVDQVNDALNKGWIIWQQ